MSANAAMARGRELAKQLMTTPVHVYSTTTVVDEETLDATEEPEVHYHGLGRVRFDSLAVAERTSSGQAYAAQQGLLLIPADATHTIRTDDHLEALGHMFRISGMHPETFESAHRFPIELIS